jgi:hypothetical protein
LEIDLLDWLKYEQSETTGIEFGVSKGEVAELDVQFEALWRESVKEEVNRRLAARELTVKVQQPNENGRQNRDARERLRITTGVHSNLPSAFENGEIMTRPKHEAFLF